MVAGHDRLVAARQADFAPPLTAQGWPTSSMSRFGLFTALFNEL
jgi:hypothetical protein